MLEQFGKDRENFLGEPEKKAEIFRKITNSQSKRYYITFFIFELLNYIIGILVFVLTDSFLSQKFSTYGLDTINYLIGNGKTIEIQGNSKLVEPAQEETVNPMCNLFPTVVNCEYTFYGTVKGTKEERSGLCLMKQNFMNQKIYLILWIWFFILFGISLIMIAYRIAILIFPQLARRALLSQMKTSECSEVEKLLVDFEHIGNWFLLTQIGQNANPYKLRTFIKEAKQAEESFPNTTSKTKKFIRNSNANRIV